MSEEYFWTLDLARKAICNEIGSEKRNLSPDEFPDAKATGVFVTLWSPGKALRGCIGHISPIHDKLFNEVIDCAIASATQDPRFPSLHPREIDRIKIEVSILEPTKPVHSKDLLDPKVFGVVVKSGWRKGVLLPDIDGVDTVEQQLGIALQKAGIYPDETYDIESFKVIKIRED